LNAINHGGILTISKAGIAQLVERNLAKVEVASSNLVSRSILLLKNNVIFLHILHTVFSVLFLEKKMKKLLLIPMLISAFASAELYVDYAPASEPVELTVIAVQSNYLDTYLTNLNRTWVRAMNVQKKLGYITDFSVWTAMSSADTPNVWLTVEYPDMASMAQSKAKSDKVEAELAKLYGDDEGELEEISKGYEEIREMVDHAVIHRVEFK
tara:strand:+ start:214 stop:846 length:633 start_codon:yes stop_codon:yes gene_type:complete